MGGKPRKKPLTPFERVREMTHERVKSALASGYRLRRGTWTVPPNDDGGGTCCALGAIAFDGEQPRGIEYEHIRRWSPTVDRLTRHTYALARKQLLECGIDGRTGVILDAISDGFEGCWGRTRASEPSDKELPKLQPYFDLGKEIWETYGRQTLAHALAEQREKDHTGD